MRIPASTYRLQLNPDCTFADARDAVEYLDALGVDTAYVSPILASRTGSPHGYDVVDPTRLDDELGGPEGFDAFAAELAAKGLGLLVDIVPNHMAADEENPGWWDVLRRGRASRFAPWFDIDWDAWGGKVVLPVLGDLYGAVLERGELRLVLEGGVPIVRYFDRRFPLNDTGRRRLGRFRANPGDAVAYVDDRIDLLDELLGGQYYRLAYWRSGQRDLNYRRFFDITDLVSLRVEDAEVFEATHALIGGLVRHGPVTGLRIDHVDGLWDPEDYLDRLRASLPQNTYVVVEKILEPDEELPRDWSVDGTTGYEFARACGGLFVDPEGADELRRHAETFTGDERSFDEIVDDAKRRALTDLFDGEVTRLADRGATLLADDRLVRDLSPDDFAAAVRELCAELPVYRTYVREGRVSSTDRRRIKTAVGRASDRLPYHQAVAAELLGELVTGDRDPPGRLDWTMRFQQLTGPAMAKGSEDTALYRYPALTSRNEVGGDPGDPAVPPQTFHDHNRRTRDRWPDTLTATSTHDTKRGEDVRARIDVLSEIPERWTELVERWRDRHVRYRTNGAPDPAEELLCYQTIVGASPFEEDAQRSFPERLRAYVVKAAREAKTHTSWRDPDPDHERALEEFCTSVLRDEDFVGDLEGLLEVVGPAGALNSLAQSVLQVASPGVPDRYRGAERWWLRLVDPDNRAPVDLEHNRRLLEELDEGAARDLPGLLDDLLTGWTDGRVKLFVISRALRHRRANPELYARGDYHPLDATGREKGSVVAFARHRRGDRLCCIAPRLGLPLDRSGPFPLGRDAWGRTAVTLPDDSPAEWRSVLTDQALRTRTRKGRRILELSEVFESFPVALLTGRKEA